MRLTEYFWSMSWVILVFYTHRIERKNRVMIHFVDDAVIENREELQQKAKDYIDDRTYNGYNGSYESQRI